MRAACVAGLNAAVAGVAGKVAFDSDAVVVRAALGALRLPDAWIVPARVVVLGLLLLANAMVFRMLARGMDAATSHGATVVASGTNFLASAALGAVLFGEALTWRWLAGAALMVLGMATVASDSA